MSLLSSWGWGIGDAGAIHLDHPYSYRTRGTIPRENRHYHSPTTMAEYLPLYLGLGTLAVASHNYAPHEYIRSVHQDNHRDLDGAGPLRTVYQWRILDFQYNTAAERSTAIALGDFIPENNLPLGLDVWGDRLFVTMPRWKPGVPATLSWLPLPPKEKSPAMVPYPDWSWHQGTSDCGRLISVFRTYADDCGRLWVVDAGLIDTTTKPKPVCPPKIVVFDLNTDRHMFTFVIPPKQVKEDSLHSNIVVDVRNGQCDDAYAYVTDVWRFGIVVYSLKLNRSWRTTSNLFFPNPIASDFTLHDLNFQWTDGIFGLSMAPIDHHNDRVIFFHPMASFKEFAVSASVLKNESIWIKDGTKADAFSIVGDRGQRGQISASAIDRDGIMFFNLVSRDAVGCWDLRKSYDRSILGIVAEDASTLLFPNDLKVDHQEDQGVWVLSNKLPFYLYRSLDYKDINFRILRASTKEAVKGTVCDPKRKVRASYVTASPCA